MADQREFQTVISFGGKIDPALRSILKSLGGDIKTVAAGAKQLGKDGREGFGLFKQGAEQAAVATDALGDSVKALLGPVLGIAAAFSSFEGIMHVLDDAGDKFKKNLEKTKQVR